MSALYLVSAPSLLVYCSLVKDNWAMRFRMRGKGATWVMEPTPDLRGRGRGRDRLSWEISSLHRRNLRIRGIALAPTAGGASRGIERTDEMQVPRVALKDMAWTGWPQATRGGHRGMGWREGLGASRDVLKGMGWTEDPEVVRGVLEDTGWTEGTVTLITTTGRVGKEFFRQSRIGEALPPNHIDRDRPTARGRPTGQTQ